VRENRSHGSEGGEAKAFPTPIAVPLCFTSNVSTKQRRVDGRDKFGHDGDLVLNSPRLPLFAPFDIDFFISSGSRTQAR
jgi:hypothetical protein